MTRHLARIALVSLLLSLGAIAAACGGGGDDELTLDAYLERMAEIGADFNTSGDELQVEFDDRQAEASTDEESIDVLVDFISATIAVFETFADDARGLEPPAEAQAAHDDAITSARGVIDVLRDAEDDLEDASTEEEAFEVVGQLLETDVINEFERTCFDLQTIAEDENIDVDLECGS